MSAAPLLRPLGLVTIGASLTLVGCAAVNSYENAGRYVAPGGIGDQQKTAAAVDLQRQQTQNIVLQDEKVQRERELKRVEDRLKAVDADLVVQDKLVADAVKARKISQQRANELKKEMDSVRSEMQQIDLQNKAAALGKPDSVADKAKEDRLKALEARKKALETFLAQAAGKR